MSYSVSKYTTNDVGLGFPQTSLGQLAEPPNSIIWFQWVALQQVGDGGEGRRY